MHSLLSLQPVFPSKIRFHCYRLHAKVERTLQLLDLSALEPFGVDIRRYQDRTYERTQAIADSAYFLGFDGLLVPSARWACVNAVLFTDRFAPEHLSFNEDATTVIDWVEWRRQARSGRNQ